MLELYITLAFEFFKTGLFAIGGGLATIPFLKEMSDVYGWFDIDTLSMMIGFSESTPGPMGINMSTYVGFNTAGILGALISTLSIVAPSIIIITIIAHYLKEFKKLTIVQEIFAGIKPAVIAFIIAAVLDLFISTLLHADAGLSLSFFNIPNIIIFAILLVVYTRFPKIHPIFIILIAALCGVIFSL